jgi:hypothetical protein
MKNMYTTLCEFQISLCNNISSPLILSKDDVVSIAVQQDFDKSMFPMIRVRLYTDITTLTYINENPKNLDITISNVANVYELNQDGSRDDKIIEAGSVGIYTDKRLRCYIESKNAPYTKFDNYQQGIKKDNSLNTTTKVPITLYCYDDETIRNTKRKVPSIYKNTTLHEVVNYMATSCDIQLDIIPFDNNERFDQILIPNLSFIDAIAYLDSYYGLYETGGMLSVDVKTGRMILSGLNAIDDKHYCGILVRSYKSGDTYSGLWLPGSQTTGNSFIATPDTSVVVKSITDIEQTINSKVFSSINVNDFNVESSSLNETYENSTYSNITTPDLIHKTKNKFLTSMYKTLVEEKNTQIDVAVNGVYVPIWRLFSAYDRFVLSFDNTPRAININRVYRPMRVTDVFTNIGSGLFSGQTTIQLC